MSVIVFLLFVLAFLLLGTAAVIIWAMHQRIENLAEKLITLVVKVKEGENVIIENFGIIEKRFNKVEHEIKEASRKAHVGKATETIKAIRQFERSRTDG